MSENNHKRTYRELCESIKTILDGQGTPSSSNRYPLHLIYDTVLDMRTSYIKRTKISRRGIGRENVQTIGCVKLEEIESNICPCSPPTGCSWLRSTKPIPKTISLISVTNTNAAFKADYVEWSQFKNKLYSRTRKDYTRYYTIMDIGEGPYVYLFNDSFLNSVSLSGLWESPNHAAYFTSCDEETKTQEFLRCNPLDTPLYMDGDIVDVVFKMTVDFLLRSGPMSVMDVKNDSLHTPVREFNNDTV
jgi:hypothetical protein